MKKALIIALLAIFASSCSTLISRARTELIDEPLECTGFALIGTYLVYEDRAEHLFDDPRLEEHQRPALTNARKAAEPFVRPTMFATVRLVEYLEEPYIDHAQRVILERNLEFWIHHFRPHVDVLVNTVRGTNFHLYIK